MIKNIKQGKRDSMLQIFKDKQNNNNSLQALIVEYARICAEEKVNPIQILRNIQQNELKLENIVLNDDYCRALGRFLPSIPDLEKIKFGNNSLSDEGFVKLIEGMRKSKKVRSLECEGNSIGEKSLLELANILGRGNEKEQFVELSLNKVKMATSHLNTILECMGNNCPLRKLSLSRMNFNEISIEWIKKILKKADNLYSINLSGSEMLSISLKQILIILSKNRRLEYVNLAWLPVGSQGELTISSLKEEIMNNLYTFIIRNKQLIHLDLSYSRITNMNLMFYQGIIAAMKKSKSLLCVHLTGNGITDKGKQEALKELQGVSMVYDRVRDEFESLEKAINKESPKSKKAKHKMMPDEKLIFWRIKNRMNYILMDKWIQSNSCFICDNWKYTVFVYSKELAAKKLLQIKESPTSK